MSAYSLVCLLTLFCLATGKVRIAKQFPHIEIHENEVLRFEMEDYFYGTSLRYSMPPSSHVYFNYSQLMCRGTFVRPILQAFKYTPLNPYEPHLLFLVDKEFSMAKYTISKTCLTDPGFIELPPLVQQDLVNVTSLVVGFDHGELRCFIKAVVDSGDGLTDVLISFAWGALDNAENIIVSPAGSLLNATLLPHHDMLVAYYKCVDRSTCDVNTNGKNAVYVYQMAGQNLDELAPYLVARLDAEFFHKQSIKISTVRNRQNGLLICDIENNIVYVVDISVSSRLPLLVHNYTFTTRVDSLSMVPFADDFLTFASSRIGSRLHSEVYRLRRNQIHGVYYNEFSAKQDHIGSDNVTLSTCTTAHYHFTLLYNRKLQSDYRLRAMAIKYSSYSEVIPITRPLLVFDCLFPKEDYVIGVERQEYYVYQFHFPELVVDYRQSSAHLSEPLKTTLRFTVHSDDEDLLIERELIVYPLNDLRATLSPEVARTHYVHNYKGMVQTMDLSEIYGGVVKKLDKLSGKAMYKRLSLSSRWKEFSELWIYGEKDRHWQIIKSAEEENLFFKGVGSAMYAFAFTKEAVNDRELIIYCFDLDEERKVIQDCTSLEAGLDLVPDPQYQGRTIVMSSGNYITLSQNATSGQSYFTRYHWTKQSGLRQHRKYITHAISSGDEVVSLVMYDDSMRRVLIVYGNNNGTGFYLLFNVTDTIDRWHTTFMSRQTLPQLKLLKMACMRNVSSAIALCEQGVQRQVYIVPFLEGPVKNLTKLETPGKVIDLISHTNELLLFTEDDQIFHYSGNTRGIALIKQIPVPAGYSIAKRNGIPIYNKEITFVQGTAYLILILTTMEKEQKKYKMYVADIRLSTHNGPVTMVDLESRSLDEEMIYGIYTRYMVKTETVLIVTSKFIKAYVLQITQELKINSMLDGQTFSNETFLIYPAGRPDLNLTFKYTEVNTTLAIYQDQVKSDSMHALAGNFSFPVSSFVKGHSLSHKVIVSKTTPSCEAWMGEPIELLQEKKYDLVGISFIVLTESKLFLSDSTNNFYAINYNFENQDEIITSHLYFSNITNSTGRSSFKVLQVKHEGTYLLSMQNCFGGGKPFLGVYNTSHNLIYWTELPAQGGITGYVVDNLKAFVWVFPVTGSFYGEVIIVHKTHARAYQFNSIDLNCDHTSDFKCDTSRLNNILYCVNMEGTIHSILIESEKATLLSKTSIPPSNKHFPFMQEGGVLEIKGIVATATNELFIDTAMGFLRCSCGNSSRPLINCYRRSEPDVLNLIPNYDKTDENFLYVTDGRMLVTKLKSKALKTFHVIRMFDLMSPFDRTEVVDFYLTGRRSIDSYAINSVAFKGSGALFVTFDQECVRVYKFYVNSRVNVHTQGKQCDITVVSASPLGSKSAFSVTIHSIMEKELSLAIIFGVWITLLGFGTIALLIRHYYTQSKKEQSHIVEETKTPPESRVLSEDSSFPRLSIRYLKVICR